MEPVQRQIESSVAVPADSAGRAVLHLLSDEPFEALNALAHLASPGPDHDKTRFVPCRASDDGPLKHDPCCSALVRFAEALRRLESIRETLTGFGWVERALQLFLTVHVGDPDSLQALQGMASWKQERPPFGPSDDIVILAGGSAPELEDAMDQLRPHLLKAFAGLSIKLVSGGTQSGISRLAGDIAQDSHRAITGIGYLPGSMPPGAKEEVDGRRFSIRVKSTETEFTPMDPLQFWTDFMAAGLVPARVKLLCYAGGRISRTEVAIALAMGAHVAVILNPELSEDRRSVDPDWQHHPRLITLPIEASAIRTFLRADLRQSGGINR